MIPSILSFPGLDFFLIPILLPLANIGFIYKSLRAANMWEAVFADVGVSVIAILNAMRALRTK